MALSSDIVSQFVKITNDGTQKKKESTVYGKIVNDGNTKYVRIDGSEILTPVESTTAIKDGDRVSVMIKDHTAIVTGNLTSPATNDENVASAISEFDIVLASKVSTTEFDAEKARIDDLVTKNVTITSQLNANSASITNLSTDNLAVHKELSAASASITNLQASMLTAADAEIKYATIENLNVTNETVRNLSGDYASFKEMVTVKLDSQVITTDYLKANYADIGLTNVDHANVGKLLADVGLITEATISEGHVTGYLDSVKINANDITVGTLTVDRLIISGSDKSIVYALNNSGTLESTQVDTIDGGLITERTITANHIVAETITANEIHSDAVTTDKIMVGAITASKIATGTITATNGIIADAAITNAKIADAAITNAKIADAAIDNAKIKTLDASKITSGYISADRIQAGTINADKIAANAITSEKISTSALKSINYVENVSGSFLNLADGSFNSKNFKMDSYGNVMACSMNIFSGKLSFGGKFSDERLSISSDNSQNAYIMGREEVSIIIESGRSIELSARDIHFEAPVTFTSTVSADAITASQYYTNGWFRSNGPSGWYSETYGGGIWMIDPMWVRVYNGKSFYSPDVIKAEGELQSVAQVGLRMRRYPKNVLLSHNASDFYIFISNSDYGDANSLRPFRIGKSDGVVHLDHGAKIQGHNIIYSHANNIYSLADASTYLELNTSTGAHGINWWNSDSRLKQNIVPSDLNALCVINSIKHCSFMWKNDGRTVKLGYIAQQLESIEEQLVFKVPQSNEYTYSYLYQIDETHLIPYITKAIQEISLLDDERDLKIEHLQKQVYELQFQIQKLQNGGNQVC